MPSKAQEYFDKRALEDAVRIINLSEDFIEQKLKKYYKKASKEIQEYIEEFYKKFANQEDITLAEAKRMIKKADFKNIDFEALAKYAIVAEDEQLSTYVNALSKKGQITRLELLNLEINKTLSKLFDEEQVSVYELLADTYEDSYYRNIYNVQSYFQIGVDFIKPDENVIRNAVTQSWAKSNYSERIWGHKKQLAGNLREHITTGLIQGNSIDKMASKMSKDMDVSLNNAKRLVRTETNYIHNKATLDSYKEYADIEQYKYLATLDNRTSKQCQELDCKVFDTKDAEVGTNYPPMHPNCRSTTVVYFKDDPEGNRIARGADGKTYYVSADISYKEWKEKYITLEEDSLIDKVRHTTKGKLLELLEEPKIKVVSFMNLPKDYKMAFIDKLTKSNSDVRSIVLKELYRTDFFISNDNNSHYSPIINVIKIDLTKPPSTLAHEIFHKIDSKYGYISEKHNFRNTLSKDYLRLETISNLNIKNYLIDKYPDAFEISSKGRSILKEEYRGISDILSGLSEDKINLGYGHKENYWNKSKLRLSEEAWAQFGRIYFNNNPKVIKMLEDIFPKFNESAIVALKELVK